MDQSSLLDLLFTRHENQVENIEYESLLGKSDHEIINLVTLLKKAYFWYHPKVEID